MRKPLKLIQKLTNKKIIKAMSSNYLKVLSENIIIATQACISQLQRNLVLSLSLDTMHYLHAELTTTLSR
jgi:hypothetical protein